MNKVSSVLLDLDGTIINSILDISDAINSMRIDLGLHEISATFIKGFIGKGVDHLINKSLEDYKTKPTEEKGFLKRARDIFSKYYLLYNGRKTTVYGGALDGLAHLLEEGFSLSIVTNKPKDLTLQILKKINIINLFSCVVCGDTCEKCKPEPDQIILACKKLNIDPRESIMIGDSINDVLAARSAKTAAVLVLPYGYHNRKNILELNADSVIDDLTKASEWIHAYNNGIREKKVYIKLN